MRPALILLPGMDGTGELFEPLLPLLSENDVTVVQYPDRPATYAQHEAVARAELPRDRPLVVLGESYSGPVAVSIAANPPSNLVGVVLCASFVTCPSRMLRLFRLLTPLATPKLVPGFIAHHTLLGRFATPGLCAAHARALSHVSSLTLAARLRAMAYIDVREQLRRLAVPLLYLRATEDRVVPSRAGDEVAACARDARIIEIDGPHFLLQTQPDECARHIGRFTRACTEKLL
jgi:pimeloyl-[acyl-carrier protein] methyl ester esterase